MSDPSTTPPGASPGRADHSQTAGLGGEWRALRRSRSDRKVAGVLGGLARRLDVDPLVLRITTVVLAIFGVGVLLYALGWLLIPAEDEDASVAEQALGRSGAGTRRSDAIALSLGLGLLVLISAGGLLAGWGEGAILLVLAVCGVALLLLRRDDHRAPVSSTSREQPAPPAAAASLTSAADAEHADPAAPWAEGPDWDPDRPWEHDNESWDPFAEPEPAPIPPEPTRPGSSLGLLTVSAATVAVGAIAVNDVIWATVAPATYVATALGIVGLGLLLGTWWGRSRGLIALGIALSFAMVPTILIDRVDFRGQEVEVTPTTVAAIPVGTQDYGVGSVRYDLSAIEFADTDSVSLTIDQGVGELTVVLPPDVDVVIKADLGVGEIRALSEVSGGFGQEARIVDDGTDGPGGGELDLGLDLGIGSIEVRREAA